MPQQTKLKRAWIITHHAPILPLYETIASEDLVLAVDQGLEVVHSVGLRPSLIIGDFDSLSDLDLLGEYHGVPIRSYNPEKNETDSELALSWAIDHGAEEIIICNDMGGMFDHALGLIPLLHLAEAQGIPCRIETGTQQISLLGEEQVLDQRPGTIVSLIPLTDEAAFSSSRGLKYTLKDLVITRRQTRGISNLILTSPAQIVKSRGEVLLIVTIL